MDNKQTLLILFGGASSEHEVSCISASSVLENINKEKYNIITVGITKKGLWYYTKATTEQIESGEWEFLEDNKIAVILTDFTRSLHVKNLGEFKIDVVFPVLHGKNGEDGTVQGLLELADIPFVGPDSTASAACMDKAITKAVVEQAGICDQAESCIVHKGCDVEDVSAVIEEHFDFEYPLFVKPANAGSSVGISKVKSRGAIPEALNVAFAEDKKAIVEKAIVGREIEVAVLGNSGASGDKAPKASLIGEIFAANEFYDYIAKYNDVGSRTGIVTDLSPRVENAIRDIAVGIFEIMGCDGMSRVDFFLEPDKDGGYENGRLVFNEINTIPGFTKISMYPQLWQASGMTYSELIDKLIYLAVEKDK